MIPSRLARRAVALALLALLALPLACGVGPDAAGPDADLGDGEAADGGPGDGSGADGADGADGDAPQGVHAVTRVATVSAAAVVLDEAVSVTVAKTDDTLVFAGVDRPDLMELEAGTVLVGTAGRGFLRTVESVSAADGQITVHTSPATLEDLFDDASFTLSLPLDGGPLDGGPSDSEPPGGAQAPCFQCAVSPWLNADLGGTVVYENHEGAGKSEGFARATLSPGRLVLAPRFSFDYTKSFLSGVHFLSFDAKGTFNASLGLEVAFYKMKIEGKLEKSLLSQTFRIMVGTVPVVITPEVSLVLEGDMGFPDAFGRASAGLQIDGVIDATTTFDSERTPPWDGWSHGGFELSALPFEVSGAWSVAASVNLALRLKASVKIYDVAGPYIDLGPVAGLAFNYGSTAPAPEMAAPGTWAISGGVQARIGVEASILGHDLFDYNRVFLEQSGPIASGDLGTGDCDRAAAQACWDEVTNDDIVACVQACVTAAACPEDPPDWTCKAGIGACQQGDCGAERWAHRQTCFGLSGCDLIGLSLVTEETVTCQLNACEDLASCIRANVDVYAQLMSQNALTSPDSVCSPAFSEDEDACDALVSAEAVADFLDVSLPPEGL